MKGYPRHFTRVVVLTAIGLFVTGLLLVPSMLDFRLEMNVPWRLDADGRLVTVAAHAFVAFFMLMLAGSLWSIHMRAGWRKRRHRTSGTILATSLALMAATGIGIYYLGDEDLSLWSSLVHTGLGLVGAGFFTWHAIRGRLAAREHARQTRKPPVEAVSGSGQKAAE
ncbi:MAG: hypothetical protein EP335_17675 [Alphaproteobacteria bacterium]|nr:MAG: hypothetical protein EP335_17675 [Alphaproteobacteria bacterium]